MTRRAPAAAWLGMTGALTILLGAPLQAAHAESPLAPVITTPRPAGSQVGSAEAPPLTTPLSLDTVKGELGFCGGVKGVDDQLLCFEKVASDLGLTVTTPDSLAPASSTAPYRWAHTTHTKPDGIEAVAAIEASRATSTDITGGDVHATLYLRCAGRQQSLYVDFHRPVSPEQLDVKMALNGDAAGIWHWYPSASTTAFGLWSSAQSVPLVKALLQSGSFGVEAALPAGRILSARFELAGMKDAITDVRSACGW